MSAEEKNPFAPGSWAHDMWATTAAMPKPKRPERANRGAYERKRIQQVRLTGTGESKLQNDSQRARVLRWIENNNVEGVVDVDAMEADLGFPVRGHVQKLIEKRHLEVVK